MQLYELQPGWIPIVLTMGIGATLAIDLWAQLLKRSAGIAPTDWGVVGRWFAQLAQGQTKLPQQPIPHERLLGWSAHYAIGVAYALLYVLISQATATPLSLGTALLFGLVTVLAPWLILMPGLGKGWFAAKTPVPNLTRALNLATHLIFGAGLYLMWWILHCVSCTV